MFCIPFLLCCKFFRVDCTYTNLRLKKTKLIYKPAGQLGQVLPAKPYFQMQRPSGQVKLQVGHVLEYLSYSVPLFNLKSVS